MRDIKSPQRERRIVFKIDETGGVPALTFGQYQMTVTDTGVGDYLLTLNTPGVLACLALAGPATDSRLVRIGTCTVNTVQILVDDLAGAAADGDVIGEVIAFDMTDQT